MQITPIPRALALALTIVLAGCAAGSKSVGESPAASATVLSMPEHVLDALPLEHLLSAEFSLREQNLDKAASEYLQAAQTSDRVEIARRATRINLAAQRWTGAAAALARWRALVDDQPPELQQAALSLALGQGDKAAGAAGVLALVKPGGMPAARLVAGALDSAPDRALALSVLEEVSQSPQLPDDPAVLIGLSQAALGMERNDLAEALAERATDRLPESPEAWFWRARLANASGDTAAARQVLDQAVQINPDNPEIRRTYAVLLKNEFGDAAAAAQALAGLPPDDETLALRAAYAMDASDWAQVQQAREALMALPEPHPPARIMLLGGIGEALAEAAEQDSPGSTAEQQRWRAEAADWYGRITVDSPEEYAHVQQRLAVLAHKAGDIDAAKQRLERLRGDIDPGSAAFANSYLLEAELLRMADRRDEELAILKLGVSALPEDPRLRYARALALEQRDQIDAALEDLRYLVENQPDNPMFLNALGYTMADRTDRHEEALVLIERALEIDPDDIAATDSMGWVLFKLGRYEESIHYLRIAYAAQPDGEIGAHLGEVLWVSGDRAEARRIWREAQAADPEHRVLKTTIERFKPW